MYQEGQHGMVHTAFNDHLKSQGIAVDHILERQKQIMFGFFRKYLPKTFTLGQTAAAEHMTALMAHGFFARSEEHTSELQSLMRISYAVFCLKKKNQAQSTKYNNT